MNKSLLRTLFVATVIASAMAVGCDKKDSGSAASTSGGDEPTCEAAMQKAGELVVQAMPESAREAGKAQIASQMATQVAKCKSEKYSVEMRKCMVAAKSNEELDKCK
jgi:hypothetical protein